MSDKIDILINLIDRARKEVNALNSKGWYFHNHQFIFNPIISDDEIRSIEDKYRILFPSEYKEFLKRIGNGGSQPAYGMLTAEESAAVHSPRLASPGVFENNELVSYYSDLADIDSKISCGSDEKEFDDYLNLDTNKFIYGDLYSFNLDEYNIVDRRMRDHLLVFSLAIEKCTAGYILSFTPGSRRQAAFSPRHYLPAPFVHLDFVLDLFNLIHVQHHDLQFATNHSNWSML